VEPHDGDVVWNSNPVIEKRVLEPERAEVVEDEDPVRPVGKRGDTFAKGVARAVVVPLAVERILEDESLVDGEAGLSHGPAVATAADFEHATPESVADKADPPATERDEMPRRDVAGRVQIEADERDAVAFGVGHHHVRDAAVMHRPNRSPEP